MCPHLVGSSLPLYINLSSCLGPWRVLFACLFVLKSDCFNTLCLGIGCSKSVFPVPGGFFNYVSFILFVFLESVLAL